MNGTESKLEYLEVIPAQPGWFIRREVVGEEGEEIELEPIAAWQRVRGDTGLAPAKIVGKEMLLPIVSGGDFCYPLRHPCGAVIFMPLEFVTPIGQTGIYRPRPF
ncbi:TPA: hypothetical protein KNG84_003459 [Serratia fonticola]|nr:hypothetical protein [Serratia fonticola]HBE9091391.1 hypothetical protein [Serratia fonticola]